MRVFRPAIISYHFQLFFLTSLSVRQVTCIGTSAEQATAAWDMYAFDGNVLSNSVFVGLGSVSQSNIRYVSLAGVQGYITTSHLQVISTRKISHVCIHLYVQQMIFPLKGSFHCQVRLPDTSVALWRHNCLGG